MSDTARTSILLIEHDHLTLRVLSGILSSAGFDVIPTSSPMGLVEILPLIDVVLCSYDMPYVMTDVVRSMKKSRPDIPIYMSSVTAHHELTEEVLRHTTGYLKRPLRMEYVQQFIAEVTSLSAQDKADPMKGAA